MRRRGLVAALLLPALASCPGGRGCDGGRAGSRPLGGALALVPSEARLILYVDFARIRGTATWSKLSALSADRPEDKQRIDDLTRRTGLDPFRQIHSILAAFPEDARKRGEFGLVIRGEGFDEKRLVAYAGDVLRGKGHELRSAARRKRILWSDTRDAAASGFFLDYRTFVAGGGGWAEKIADLADGVAGAASAESNGELASLCQRARGSGDHAIWGAAVVPADVRRQLAAEPRFQSAASVSRLAAGIHIGAGLQASLAADLSNAADAQAMVGRLVETVREAKRSPPVLMMGLGPYLDALRTEADGPSFRVKLALDEAQVTDLLGRLAGLARMGAGR